MGGESCHEAGTEVTAYYNEHDPKAAAWLRELIAEGLIADGIVDERSILDVEPEDVAGFTQCHWFAGIGGWSYALRLAGWPDDRSVWTGSPPCQPFSAAGKRDGKHDDRHLAPHFVELVRACRPGVLYGEQVASALVLGKVAGSSRPGDPAAPAWAWFDALSDELEAAHYAVGANDIPAAGLGAPHIRQRLFFGAYDLRSTAGGLADGRGPGLEGQSRLEGGADETQRRVRPDDSGPATAGRAPDGVADTERDEQRQGRGPGGQGAEGPEPGPEPGGRGPAGRLADAHGAIPEQPARQRRGSGQAEGRGPDSESDGRGELAEGQPVPGPVNGFWAADPHWLFCRDGKWRVTQSRIQPLAERLPGRVALLRGAGNSIVPQVAAEFILAFEEARHGFDM